MAKIYRREKIEGKGWRHVKVRVTAGRPSADAPPYYLRTTVNGERKWSQPYPSFDAVKKAAAALDPKPKPKDGDRLTIQDAVAVYLVQKATKATRTVAEYTFILNQFADLVKVRFMDEITVDVLRAYMRELEKLEHRGKKLAGKTIRTRIEIVYFMLKKNKVEARVPNDEMPTVEVEAAVPYSEAELKKLFSAMTPEDRLVYNFFLGSACRDREVQFAMWADIDFEKCTYTVRSKSQVGFFVKSHESRTVPLPASVVKPLKSHQKKNPHRWIFATDTGEPGNHFLRKLKKIALHAGVNCGECKATVTKGKYQWRRTVEVTCKTDPVCEHIILHRFRKTCATRWHTWANKRGNKIDLRTIQYWLGHKSLVTTQLYLGVTASGDLRENIDGAFGD